MRPMCRIAVVAFLWAALIPAAMASGVGDQPAAAAGAGEGRYPNRSIRLIVPWPAGGTTDLLGRLLSKQLTAEFHQPFYVDNIAGAGGNVGTQQFVQAKPDGYTLLLASSSTNAANPYLYETLGFKPVKDFTPVAMVARVPDIMVVSASSPYKSFGDIVSAAKAKPGGVFYASAGTGSSPNLVGELLKKVARIDVTHVPFKGMAPAILDVMSGRCDYTFGTGVDGNIENGRLRAIAVTTEARIKALPNVPTFKELDLKGMEFDVWFGVAGPAGLPKEIVTALNSAINKALSSEELARQTAKLGADSRSMTPETFTAFWQSEVTRYAQIVRVAVPQRLD